MTAYAQPADVRLAANPEWRPGSPEPDAASQDASSLTDTQLAASIATAQRRVDSYLAARYTVPVPAEQIAAVKDYTVAIALWDATLTWLRNLPMDDHDPVALRYAAAISDLAGIARGTLTLTVDTAGEDAPGGGFAGVVASGTEGLFDASDAGYHPPGVGYGRLEWNHGGYLYG